MSYYPSWWHDPMLDQIYQRLIRLEIKMANIQEALVALTAQVAKNTEVETSAIELIRGLADQIAAAAGDPAQVEALSSQLKASADSLAAAITANTPAA